MNTHKKESKQQLFKQNLFFSSLERKGVLTNLTLSTVNILAVKTQWGTTLLLPQLEPMLPNDADGERKSEQCIYHCQIWLWRLWWDAELLHNAYVVFVMS